MAEPKVEWTKDDTLQTWRSLKSRQHDYLRDMKARLPRDPQKKEILAFLMKKEHKEIFDKFVATFGHPETVAKGKASSPQSSPKGSPRGDGSAAAKAALSHALVKWLGGREIEEFDDNDLRKNSRKIQKVHAAVLKVSRDKAVHKYVEHWLAAHSRRGLRVLVDNCIPIDDANFQSLFKDMDDPNKVSRMNPNTADKLWIDGLRTLLGVQNLGEWDLKTNSKRS